MKIGEASKIYSARMASLRDKRSELLEQKKALEKGEIQMTDDEAVSLKKAIDRVEIQYEKASEFMQGFNMRKSLMQNAEASRQQGDAMAKQTDDYVKCIEVARRIARGDKVPMRDEKKLLEFNAEMYQTAKSLGSMKRNGKPKEHKSLWKNGDEDNTNKMSPEEVVNNMECGEVMPAEFTADTDGSE